VSETIVAAALLLEDRKPVDFGNQTQRICRPGIIHVNSARAWPITGQYPKTVRRSWRSQQPLARVAACFWS
jgi:hypothetical protein